MPGIGLKNSLKNFDQSIQCTCRVPFEDTVSWALFFPAIDDSSTTRTMLSIVSTKDLRYKRLNSPKKRSGANY